MKPQEKRIPILGKLNITHQYQIASSLILVCSALFIYFLFTYWNEINKANETTRLLTDFALNIQKIDTLFQNDGLAKQKYKEIQTFSNNAINDYNSIKELKSILFSNNKINNIQSQTESALNQIRNNSGIFKTTYSLPQKMNFQQTIIVSYTGFLNDIESFIKTNNQQTQLRTFFDLKSYLEKIKNQLDYINSTDKIEFETIEELLNTQNKMTTTVNSIEKEISTEDYNRILNDSNKMADIINKILSIDNTLLSYENTFFENKKAIHELNNNTYSILESYKLEKTYETNMTIILVITSLLLLSLSIMILVTIIFFKKHNDSIKNQAENENNNNSIMRLLTELLPLQEGNLTQKATVTDEITGAIADSINAVIDSLKFIVKNIRDVSNEMKEKTDNIKVISEEMMIKTINQVNDINSAGRSVIKISDAMNEISQQTHNVLEQTKKTVEISEFGEKNVKESITSIKTIKLNMENTTTLMKNVENSSKQISEIIELLTDLNEVTSVLALNATVQAAKAGEHGSGFKVVADSIQELANKSGESAKKVSHLILAVQRDITVMHNAIKNISNEIQTSVNVSEKAGNSLNKIIHASKELEITTESILKNINTYTETSKTISKNVQTTIVELEKNKESTKKTVDAISDMYNISNELGKSVKTFKID